MATVEKSFSVPVLDAHTSEPWKYSVNIGPTKGLIVDAKGFTILALDNEMRDSRFETIVRRIVACVNACHGTSNEMLAGLPDGNFSGLFEIAELGLNSAHESLSDAREFLEQRNELAVALRKLYAAIPDNKGGALGAACKEARAVLSKVET